MEGIVKVRTIYDKESEKRLKKRLKHFLLILSGIIVIGVILGLIFGEEVFWIAMMPASLSFFLILFIGSMLLMIWLRKALFPRSALYYINKDIIRIKHFRFGEYDIPIRDITRVVRLAEDVNYKAWKLDRSPRSELKLPAEGFINPYRVQVSEWIGSNSEKMNKTYPFRFNSFIIGDDEERTGYRTLRKLYNDLDP